MHTQANTQFCVCMRVCDFCTQNMIKILQSWNETNRRERGKKDHCSRHSLILYNAKRANCITALLITFALFIRLKSKIQWNEGRKLCFFSLLVSWLTGKWARATIGSSQYMVKYCIVYFHWHKIDFQHQYVGNFRKQPQKYTGSRVFIVSKFHFKWKWRRQPK